MNSLLPHRSPTSTLGELQARRLGIGWTERRKLRRELQYSSTQSVLRPKNRTKTLGVISPETASRNIPPRETKLSETGPASSLPVFRPRLARNRLAGSGEITN